MGSKRKHFGEVAPLEANIVIKVMSWQHMFHLQMSLASQLEICIGARRMSVNLDLISEMLRN